MKIVVYYHSAKWSNPWLDSFCEGLQRHGVEPVRAYYGQVQPADVSVFYSAKPLVDVSRKGGGRCLIMEMGYVADRWKYQSLLWDGLNGRGRHPRVNDGGERWRKQFGEIEVKPWRIGGDYVLLVGQVASDQSVQHLDVVAWYGQAAAEIRATTSLPVFFKPHPVSDERRAPVPKLPGVEVKRGDLGEILSRAAYVVTINSNVGVLSALAGVPVVATDEGAMCWPVSSHKLSDPLVLPDRTDWLTQLAWAQWTQDEIASGDAWSHVCQSLYE